MLLFLKRKHIISNGTTEGFSVFTCVSQKNWKVEVMPYTAFLLPVLSQHRGLAHLPRGQLVKWIGWWIGTNMWQDVDFLNLGCHYLWLHYMPLHCIRHTVLTLYSRLFYPKQLLEKQTQASYRYAEEHQVSKRYTKFSAERAQENNGEQRLF